MPLHPDAVAVLAATDDADPRYELLDPGTAREQMRARRLANPAIAEPIAHVEDRIIPGPAGDLPVRVYTPKPGRAAPLVVFLHGGGWVLCDIDSHDPLCRRLANATGAVVVSVGYRLAPEHRFPAALDDAYAATCWSVDHADALGVDATRVAVAGDSAGGNLAAAVCLMARDRGGPALTFQLLVYPVLDHDFTTPSYEENAAGPRASRAAMQWFWDHYLGDDADGRDPYASPLRAPDLSGLPPAYVVTAECDPLRDEGERYGDRLREAGVPVVVRRYDGMFHGFFSMVPLLGQATEANRAAFDALRDGLKAL